MKTPQQVQKIYDIILGELQGIDAANIRYLIDVSNIDRKKPLQSFLDSLKEKLKEEDFNEGFLRCIYTMAFHVGEIPKNCNHIDQTCALVTEDGEQTSLPLKYWINVDTVATLTNTHFKIPPVVRVRCRALNSTIETPFFRVVSSSVVNLADPPSNLNANFLAAFICGGLSGFVLMTATLAIIYLCSLGTAGICTAVGVGMLAGGGCYGFFKAMLHTNKNPIIKSKPVDIIEIFEKHFAQAEKPNEIAPGEWNEIEGKHNGL